MRTLSSLLLLLALQVQAQSLYDLTTTGTTTAFSVTSGGAVQNYSFEFDFVAPSSGTVDQLDSNDGHFRAVVIPFSGGPIGTNAALLVYDTSEPGGYAQIPIASGSEYRVLYRHNFAGGYTSIDIWNSSCANHGFVFFRITPPSVMSSLNAVTASPWTFPASGERFRFLRAYSNLVGSNAGGCPLDRPGTPGDIFDYPMENGTGTAGSAADRSGHASAITGSFNVTSTSPVYMPVSAITIGGKYALSGDMSGFTVSPIAPVSLNWPGDGTPTAYSWSISSGPGTCSTGSTLLSTLTITSCTLPGDYIVTLTVTDPSGSTFGSFHVGVVQTDVNGCVVFTDTNAQIGIANGGCIPSATGVHNMLPFVEQNKGRQMDYLDVVSAYPNGVSVTLGTGLVSFNSSTGVLTNAGNNFSPSDAGTIIEVTWDPNQNGDNDGHMLATVSAYTDASHITLFEGGNGFTEPKWLLACASGASTCTPSLTWHKTTVGSGSCTLTTTVSGGQVTAINGLATCAGLKWWSNPLNPVIAISGTGTGTCAVTATIIGPDQTTDKSLWGGVSSVSGLPCGIAVTAATAAIVPSSDLGGGQPTWQPIGNYLNYYEAGLGHLREYFATGLAAHHTTALNFCYNLYRWGTDSGINVTYWAPRDSPFLTLIGCATDPAFTLGTLNHTQSANQVFQNISTAMLNGGAPYIGNVCGAAGQGLSPTVDVATKAIDPREQSYCTRLTAKMAQLGDSYGVSSATWCTVLSNQIKHWWLPNIIAPYLDSTGSLFFPEPLFENYPIYPVAGRPAGSSAAGNSPWRAAGLPALAMIDAKNALAGKCANATDAASANTFALGMARYIENYGTAPDGGVFYAVGYDSVGNPVSSVQNAPVGSDPGSWQRADGRIMTVTPTSGSATVHYDQTDTFATESFGRQVWAGASIQINGGTYTVLSATYPNIVLTTTYSGTGSGSPTQNWGNNCAITFTNGSSSVVGSANCDFTKFFASTNNNGGTYLGLYSGTCQTGGSCPSTDARVYGFTFSDATHGTLTIGAVDGNTATPFVGTSGAYTSFLYNTQASTNCGVSLSKVCQNDDYNNRNLSQDTPASGAWLYSQTGNSIDLKNVRMAYNKTQAGSPSGGGGADTPVGLLPAYARPGTISVASGSTAVTGVGTQFLSQFAAGDKIIIGNDTSGSWSNFPSREPAFYTLTVQSVGSDAGLTLTSAYPGTGASSTGFFYNPADSTWAGPDGGTSFFNALLPPCTSNNGNRGPYPPPCGGWTDFPNKLGKDSGMWDGSGNGLIGIGYLIYKSDITKPTPVQHGMSMSSNSFYR